MNERRDEHDAKVGAMQRSSAGWLLIFVAVVVIACSLAKLAIFSGLVLLGLGIAIVAVTAANRRSGGSPRS